VASSPPLSQISREREDRPDRADGSVAWEDPIQLLGDAAAVGDRLARVVDERVDVLADDLMVAAASNALTPSPPAARKSLAATA
jgi:hypothetical protein